MYKYKVNYLFFSETSQLWLIRSICSLATSTCRSASANLEDMARKGCGRTKKRKMHNQNLNFKTKERNREEKQKGSGVWLKWRGISAWPIMLIYERRTLIIIKLSGSALYGQVLALIYTLMNKTFPPVSYDTWNFMFRNHNLLINYTA